MNNLLQAYYLDRLVVCSFLALILFFFLDTVLVIIMIMSYNVEAETKRSNGSDYLKCVRKYMIIFSALWFVLIGAIILIPSTSTRHVYLASKIQETINQLGDESPEIRKELVNQLNSLLNR